MQGMHNVSHPWDLSPKEAIALQKRMASQVVDTGESPMRLRCVAGIDVGLSGDIAVAAVVLLAFPTLDLITSATATRRVSFPYIPGLLSFREGPAIMDALGRLAMQPDLLILDGQGLAHPRRLGIACHMGLLTGLPSIGCGKTRLCGQYQEPAPEKGSHTPLTDRGDIIGAVVRTRDRVNPVFVSLGHRIDLEHSIHTILSCCTKYRLPEPIRLAHRLAAGKL